MHAFCSPKFTSRGRSRHNAINAAIGYLRNIFVLGGEADYSLPIYLLTYCNAAAYTMMGAVQIFWKSAAHIAPTSREFA